jgi:hypothetical protein
MTYFVIPLGQYKRGRKGKKDKNSGETEKMSSNVSSKRTGSGQVATDLMENISLSFP